MIRYADKQLKAAIKLHYLASETADLSSSEVPPAEGCHREAVGNFYYWIWGSFLVENCNVGKDKDVLTNLAKISLT